MFACRCRKRGSGRQQQPQQSQQLAAVSVVTPGAEARSALWLRRLGSSKAAKSSAVKISSQPATAATSLTGVSATTLQAGSAVESAELVRGGSFKECDNVACVGPRRRTSGVCTTEIRFDDDDAVNDGRI